jgi:hypothetical protein
MDGTKGGVHDKEADGENDDHNVYSDRDQIHWDDTERGVHHGENDDNNAHDPGAARGWYSLRVGKRVQYEKGVRDGRVRRGKRSGTGGCSSGHPMAQEESSMPEATHDSGLEIGPDNVLEHDMELHIGLDNVLEYNTMSAKCVADAIFFMKQFSNDQDETLKALIEVCI